MEEEFKQVANYPNYSISNFGNIKNIKTNRILKTRLRSGYPSIDLTNTDGKKTFLIHRLVAMAFIENPQNKRYIDHINNNKLDNKATNLRWASNSENNHNKPITSNNKSGCKGVSCMRNSKFRASICINYKTIYIGIFNTLEEAINARKLKETELLDF